MSWKCPDCDHDNHDNEIKCRCGTEVAQAAKNESHDYKERALGVGGRFFIIYSLASIAATLVSYHTSTIGMPDGPNKVAYYIGSGFSQILFTFVIFLMPALLYNYFSKKNKVKVSKLFLSVLKFNVAFNVFLMMGSIYAYMKDKP